MANILAAATGNWFTAASWVGGVVPKLGDSVYTNGYNITINAVTVTAGSFEVGYMYKIKTVGSTDFTLIGASNNNVDTVFTATGIGSGTGDAYRVASATQVSNLAENGAAGSGTIVMNQSLMELYANVVGGTVSLVVASVAAPGYVKIVGNVFGGTYGGSGYYAVGGITTGTVIIVGDITAGSGTSSTGAAVYINTSGILTITGTIQGTSILNSTQPAVRIGASASAAVVSITGNVYGGSVYDAIILGAATAYVTINGSIFAGTAANSDGVATSLVAPGYLTVNGNVYGGDAAIGYGINVAAATTITINGDVHAGIKGHGLNLSTYTSSVIINGSAIGNDYGNGCPVEILADSYAVLNQSPSQIVITRLVFGLRGNTPIRGPVYLSGTSNTVLARLATPGSGTYDQITFTNPLEDQDFPLRSDVREGVSYDNGDLVGTLKIPHIGSVAKGVPVDNSFGTAVLLPENVLDVVGPVLSGLL